METLIVPYHFVIGLDYVLRISADVQKYFGLTVEKTKSRRSLEQKSLILHNVEDAAQKVQR